MNKTFRINEKRLAARYNRRLFLFCLPALCALASLFFISLIFLLLLESEPPAQFYRVMLYGAYGAVAYAFAACLTGSVISGILLKAHKANTFIEISGAVMIISQHVQTRFHKGAPVYYKKLWVARLTDVDEVIYTKNRITVVAKARYFNQKSDWLGYKRADGGIRFDNWWYDQNGGENVGKIEIRDYYSLGDRIARRIALCSRRVKELERKREKFRREMLETAGRARRRKGVGSRSSPAQSKRVFRP